MEGTTMKTQITIKSCIMSRPTNIKQSAKNCSRWAKNQNLSYKSGKVQEETEGKKETEITCLKALYLHLYPILMHPKTLK